MSLQAEESLGTPQEELGSNAREKDVWATLLILLPSFPKPEYGY